MKNPFKLSVAGITGMGKDKDNSEDTFQLGNEIYPNTLDPSMKIYKEYSEGVRCFSVCDSISQNRSGALAGNMSQGLLSNLTQKYAKKHKEKQSESAFTYRSFPREYHSPDTSPTAGAFGYSPSGEDNSFRSFWQVFIRDNDREINKWITRNDIPKDIPTGCSMAAMLFNGEEVSLINVGLCSVFRFKNKELSCLFKPQRLSGDSAYDRPLIYFGNHPGVDNIKMQNYAEFVPEDGEIILMMTDGIERGIKEVVISEILSSSLNLKSMAEEIFDKARENYPEDDATILLLSFQKTEEAKEAERIAAEAAKTAYDDYPQNETLGARNYKNQSPEASFADSLKGKDRIPSMRQAGIQRREISKDPYEKTRYEDYYEPAPYERGPSRRIAEEHREDDYLSEGEYPEKDKKADKHKILIMIAAALLAGILLGTFLFFLWKTLIFRTPTHDGLEDYSGIRQEQISSRKAVELSQFIECVTMRGAKDS